MKTFSQNLIALRKAAGISQKDFAQMLGIPVTTLSGYELADREPKFDMLVKMAAMLNVSVDDLLHDTFEKKFNIPQRDDFMSGLRIKVVGDTMIISFPPDKKEQMILSMQIAAGILNFTSSVAIEEGNSKIVKDFRLMMFNKEGENLNE